MNEMQGEQSAVLQSSHLLTVNDLRTAFLSLGLSNGSVVLVHSSLSRIGWVCGGASAVVQALVDVVGTHGTIMVPTHTGGNSDPSHWQSPSVPCDWWPVIREHMPAFDPLRTPSRRMGAIAEYVRTLPNAKRSDHPMVSFAAIGAEAERLVTEHSLVDSLGDHSPLGKLYDMDGMVLLLGVGYASNTSFHLAEYRAQYPKTYMEHGTAVIIHGQRSGIGSSPWYSVRKTLRISG